jgi:hypothetical protein
MAWLGKTILRGGEYFERHLEPCAAFADGVGSRSSANTMQIAPSHEGPISYDKNIRAGCDWPRAPALWLVIHRPQSRIKLIAVESDTAIPFKEHRATA